MVGEILLLLMVIAAAATGMILAIKKELFGRVGIAAYAVWCAGHIALACFILFGPDVI